MISDGAARRVSAKRLAYGASVLVAAAVAAAAAIWTMPVHERPAPPAGEIAEHRSSPPPAPSLYCVFSDFTHASVVVGFDFAVALFKDAPPRFSEIAEAVRTDPAVAFDANDRPIWSYAIDDDGTPTITSPDRATQILLYGLKRDAGNPLWIEADLCEPPRYAMDFAAALSKGDAAEFAKDAVGKEARREVCGRFIGLAKPETTLTATSDGFVYQLFSFRFKEDNRVGWIAEASFAAPPQDQGVPL